MKIIVADTRVLVYIFLESRLRHLQAQKLGLYLAKKKIRVKFPAHALFELSCAMKNKAMSAPLQIFKDINESSPLLVEPIPIDEKFFSKYFHSSLPYIKAGDLLFIALAKGESALLITEDNNQYKKAKEIGVLSYRIDEFLKEFVEL